MISSLSPQCKDIFDRLPQITCKCSTQILDKQYDRLIGEMNKCIETNSIGLQKVFAIGTNPLLSMALKQVGSQMMQTVCDQLQRVLLNL